MTTEPFAAGAVPTTQIEPPELKIVWLHVAGIGVRSVITSVEG
jgi:hypothetical protein